MKVQIRNLSCAWLMGRAKDPADPLTRAMAGALEFACTPAARLSAGIMGMPAPGLRELMESLFPAAWGGSEWEALPPFAVATRDDEYQDILDLLLRHRSDDGKRTEWLARAISAACLGGDHLYQDMGLPNRQALSELLQIHFTSLFLKNVGNMKWKKFFYKQLCDQAEINLCKAPSCGVCADYAKCFGPEEPAVPAAELAAAPI